MRSRISKMDLDERQFCQTVVRRTFNNCPHLMNSKTKPRNLMTPATYNEALKSLETPTPRMTNDVNMDELPVPVDETVDFTRLQKSLFHIPKPLKYQKHVKPGNEYPVYECLLEIRNLVYVPITYRIRACDESKYAILPSSIGKIEAQEKVQLLICTNPGRKLSYMALKNDTFQVQATTYDFEESCSVTAQHELSLLKDLWKHQDIPAFAFAQEEYIHDIEPMDRSYFCEAMERSLLYENEIENTNEDFHVLDHYDREFRKLELFPGAGDYFLRSRVLSCISSQKQKEGTLQRLNNAKMVFCLLGTLCLIGSYYVFVKYCQPERRVFNINDILYFY